MAEIVTVLNNPRSRKVKRRCRKGRKVRRNFQLRVKIRGKLRTYKALVKKIGRKKAKSVWRKSRKYHGRKPVSCPSKRRKSRKSRR